MSSKTVAEEPSATNVVITTKPTTSTLDAISDLPDNLRLQACVELTRQLLTTTSSIRTGAHGLTECSQTRNHIRGRIWQHAQGRSGETPKSRLLECGRCVR